MALEKNDSYIKNQNTCLIFAHRGSKCNRPENTLAAFQEALRVKADGIELDVHLTKDDQLVVIHDEKVNRTTSGKGRVRDLRLAELKQLDAGSWFDRRFNGEAIPTLEEVLKLLKNENFTGFLNIELKTDIINYPGIEEKIVELIAQETLPFTIIYSSFNLTTLQRLHALGVKDEIAYLAGKKMQKVSLDKVENFMSSLHLKKSMF
jgi:Glycerophosphoryl diester phosphodiesterase